MRGSPGLARSYRAAFLLLLGFFALFTVAGTDRSCLDAADSAYLISADAIAHGLWPYRDFLAAHPPLLYLLGAPLALLDAGTLPFRIFSLLILAGLSLSVWHLAQKMTANAGIAFLAGAFTLFAPLGIFFSKLFIQDALVSLIAVAAITLVMGGGRRRVALAGSLCVLGTLTKLTFLPLLLVLAVYMYRYRREQLALFLRIAIGGSLAAALILELLTGGSYFDDIILSQASKGLSFTNFYQGLHRIWEMDWPLLVAAVPGAWIAIHGLRERRRYGRLFLLLGWLAAGAALLLTLPAAGHDTNLFQMAEPAVALLAAWGIIGLAERGRLLPVAVAAILLLVSVVVLVEKDRLFIMRSNAGDVERVVALIDGAAAEDEAVLAPGCYALEAGRPVTRRFYDQFLWEEKYRRGDSSALELFRGLEEDLVSRSVPVVALEADRDSLRILGPALDAGYRRAYASRQWPRTILWLPR
ncbi:hypothetical protein BMS3Abin01_00589 [bacterium BMS3Abin01]|nr:hypothetical protein BMS3Abin01_00589 [bacterium BMS3Abin01]